MASSFYHKVYAFVSIRATFLKPVYRFVQVVYRYLVLRSPFSKKGTFLRWVRKSGNVIENQNLFPVLFDTDGIWALDRGWYMYYDAKTDLGYLEKSRAKFTHGEIFSYVQKLLTKSSTSSTSRALENSDNVVIFDVGANIGLYSFEFKRAMPNAQIHAFEPVPASFSILKKTVDKNKLGGKNGITPNLLAVGQKIGHVLMTSDEEMCNHVIVDGNTTNTVRVKCTTLDTYYSQQKIKKVDFIKIDVEGHEVAVLRGAQSLLEKNRPVVFVEICEPWMQRYNTSPKEIFDLFESLDYKYYVQTDKLRLGSYSEWKKEIKSSVDFLFVPQ